MWLLWTACDQDRLVRWVDNPPSGVYCRPIAHLNLAYEKAPAPSSVTCMVKRCSESSRGLSPRVGSRRGPRLGLEPDRRCQCTALASHWPRQSRRSQGAPPTPQGRCQDMNMLPGCFLSLEIRASILHVAGTWLDLDTLILYRMQDGMSSAVSALSSAQLICLESTKPTHFLKLDFRLPKTRVTRVLFLVLWILDKSLLSIYCRVPLPHTCLRPRSASTCHCRSM